MIVDWDQTRVGSVHEMTACSFFLPEEHSQSLCLLRVCSCACNIKYTLLKLAQNGPQEWYYWHRFLDILLSIWCMVSRMCIKLMQKWGINQNAFKLRWRTNVRWPLFAVIRNISHLPHIGAQVHQLTQKLIHIIQILQINMYKSCHQSPISHGAWRLGRRWCQSRYRLQTQQPVSPGLKYGNNIQNQGLHLQVTGVSNGK